MHSDDAPLPYLVTTAIPYVNARPHVGFAMELVLADVLARHHRQRGRDVFFLTGTDENSLKNVRAAEAEGIPTRDLVARNARAFEDLRGPLDLSYDDFIQTSTEDRHRLGAEKLWRACAASGDLYKKAYRGRYCVGCEQFYASADLVNGRCPEHGTEPELVEEENWFFRLSRWAPRILSALESGELEVVPERYRNEVLAFVRAGLHDFSVSRSVERARGWGIAVPGDPEQVMYVWFDALGNYITALGYGGEGEENDDAARWYRWEGAGERVHVIGKGITRFHAVYWPALLFSAGLALPSRIAVHGYLTVDGAKIGKSAGNAIEPEEIVREYGADVVRYYFCRHVRTGKDGDFSVERLAGARDSELADQLGNLLRRTTSMIDRYCGGLVPAAKDGGDEVFVDTAARVAAEVAGAFDRGCHDDAIRAAWSLVELGNKYVVERAPWTLAKRRDEPGVEAVLGGVLYTLAELLRLSAWFLEPFVPSAAGEIRCQLGLAEEKTRTWEEEIGWGGLAAGTRVRSGAALFPKE